MASGNLMMSSNASAAEDGTPVLGVGTHSNGHGDSMQAQSGKDSGQEFQHPMSLQEVETSPATCTIPHDLTLFYHAFDP